MKTGPVHALTPREVECLLLVHRALTSKEIAVALNLAPGTVDQHIKSANGKLGVGNRRAAARLVAEALQAPPQSLGTLPGDLADGRAIVGDADIGSASADLVESNSRPVRPYPTRDRPWNDLPFRLRLLLIVIIAIGGIAIGAGALTGARLMITGVHNIVPPPNLTRGR